MRFIHAADIHLDSPLTGLKAYTDAPIDMLRTATRGAFDNLVTCAIDEAVDFVIIAGDLYDGNWKDHNTGLYFVKQMGRLHRAGIPVYLVYGNHDAESEMTRKLQLPDNVHVFDTRRASSFLLDEFKVALHGRSFKVAATTDNLAVSYPAPVPGYFNIGVLHTALEGNAAHASYAPCSIDELHARGYQYWALGHVHEYAMWRGASVVVFPGNLQGRNVRETGAKGAVLVNVDASGHIDVERLVVDVLRWHLLEVRVDDCADFLEVAKTVGRQLEALVLTDTSGLPLALRVVVCGQTAAHGELFGLEDQLRQEVLGHIASMGNEKLWLEKVRLQTEAPDTLDALGERADALAELQAILQSAQDDPLFRAELQTELLGLVNRSPQELQSTVPWFRDIRSGDLGPLLNEVGPGLLAHLAKAE